MDIYPFCPLRSCVHNRGFKGPRQDRCLAGHKWPGWGEKCGFYRPKKPGKQTPRWYEKERGERFQGNYQEV